MASGHHTTSRLWSETGAPLFNGGTQIIMGGSFVQHNQNVVYDRGWGYGSDQLKLLQEHVCTSGYDADNKVEAPKCHPNTRIAVLDQIMDWILLSSARDEWIMWLNGAAGSGKSAIARSIIERCIKLNVLLARFFFLRSDHTRSTTRSLVATLVYQLIKCIPVLTPTIINLIRNNPLIFTQSLETQLNCLIFEPLLLSSEQGSLPPQTIIILLDGLDELSDDEDQKSLVRIMSNFVAARVVPLIVFFGSRAENQLKQAFDTECTSKLLLRLPLDERYLPDADISIFLRDGLADVKKTHPYRHYLPQDWPDSILLQNIINKASGQFIYASSVVKFVSTPNLHPGQQLQIIVHGLKPIGALTPFAQLDAIYRHIFLQVEDLENTMLVLAVAILTKETRTRNLTEMLISDISHTSIPILLANLSSVVNCKNDRIIFLHASLPDFLLDHTRSREFHIDRVAWSTRLSTEFTHNRSGLAQYIAQYTTILEHAQPTVLLRRRLTILYPRVALFSPHRFIRYLFAVQQLNFGDGGEVYRLQVASINLQLMESQEYYIHEFRRWHDTSTVVDELKRARLTQVMEKGVDSGSGQLEVKGNLTHAIQAAGAEIVGTLQASVKQAVDGMKSLAWI